MMTKDDMENELAHLVLICCLPTRERFEKRFTDCCEIYDYKCKYLTSEELEEIKERIWQYLCKYVEEFMYLYGTNDPSLQLIKSFVDEEED